MIMSYYCPLKMSYLVIIMMMTMFMPLLFFTIMNQTTILLSWQIMTMTSKTFLFNLIFDTKSLIMMMTVLFISANVLKFAKTYMLTDMFLNRFLVLLLMFILSMNLLLFLPHLMTLLLGWDGLGLTSFLLIIYYQNPKSLGAGMLTGLTNRLGDALILLSISWMFNMSSWSLTHLWESQFNHLILMSILIAAMTKSAQLPFSSWLPAAMAAPTPVSALVHSSTLVTAGVFLLIRFENMFNSTPMFFQMLLLTSCATMLMAGLSAASECDLKKIIALSTLSQLSVMMLSIALNATMIAFFHLLTHAMFKALLFICAGSFIHIHDHNQDLRLTGNLAYQLPYTSSCFSLANMALCGAPFMAGFYSKDMIIEMAMTSNTNIMMFLMILFATALTTAYSLRLTIMTLTTPNMGMPLHFSSNNDVNINWPITNLTMGAIFAGSSLNWMLTPISLESVIPFTMKQTPIILIFMGLITSLSMSNMMLSTKLTHLNMKMKLQEMSYNMWHVTPISTQIMMKTTPMFHNLLKLVDHGWFELWSAQGINNVLTSSLGKIQPIQKSTINHFIHMSMSIMLISIMLT